MSHIIDQLEASLLRHDLPRIQPGDTVKVHVKVKEGEKERIQLFQGIVIGIKGGGMRTSFTVRKVASGVGVERTFKVNSPRIEKIEVVQRGRVRRARRPATGDGAPGTAPAGSRHRAPAGGLPHRAAAAQNRPAFAPGNRRPTGHRHQHGRKTTCARPAAPARRAVGLRGPGAHSRPRHGG